MRPNVTNELTLTSGRLSGWRQYSDEGCKSVLEGSQDMVDIVVLGYCEVGLRHAVPC